MPKTVSGKHRRTLQELFAHPISMNIDFWRVASLFEALGATVNETAKDHLKVKLNGQEMSFPIPHKKNIDNKHEVVAIRDFMMQAGVAPDSES